jgi:hypothetical protein
VPQQIIDTEVDTLAPFREQVRAEQEATKTGHKMSPAAAAALKALGEHTKADKEATASFVEQFAKLPKDIWTLTELLRRIYSSDQNAWTTEVEYDSDGCVLALKPVRKAPVMTDTLLEKMADKLRWSLQHGWPVVSISDVTFLSTLTADEAKMSDDKFLSHLESTQAKNPLPLSRPTKIAHVPMKAPYWNETRCKKAGLCKAGPLCMKASTVGKPAPVVEGKKFCGDNCKETYPIRLQKQQIRALAA